MRARLKNYFKNTSLHHIIIANTSFIVIFLGSVVLFQNCSGNNKGIVLPSNKTNVGIKADRELRENLPSFPEDINIGTANIGSRIGYIVASWDQEFTSMICAGSGSTENAVISQNDFQPTPSTTIAQEVIVEGGCQEEIYTNKVWEAHSSIDFYDATVPDVNTPITLELLHSSNSKASQFKWDVAKDNVLINALIGEGTTDIPKYTYTFTEPGVYDISVTSISGDKWLSHANKRLIVGNDCRLSTSVIPEIKITEGALKWGETTTFTLQSNHLQSEIFGFEDISWAIAKNSSERKAVNGSFPSSPNSKDEIKGDGKSITIDLPAKGANSDIIHSINVYLSATTNAQNNMGVVSVCNTADGCSSSEPEILSCQSYRSKGFNLTEFTNSDGNEMVEGSGPHFVSTQPYIWTKQKIFHSAVCRLPLGCDGNTSIGCDCLPFPPIPLTFALKRLTLESHDIYRYSRNRTYQEYPNATTTSLFTNTTSSLSLLPSTTTASLPVTSTTQTNSQPREHLAFFNAHIVGASNCSYDISYSHKAAEQGTFDCGAISDVPHTIEEPSDNYTPAGGGWIPFTLHSSGDCQEATITIKADSKEETYYNYCPKTDYYRFSSETFPSAEYYYTDNCYFGPIAQRPERHTCDFEYPTIKNTPATFYTTEPSVDINDIQQ